MNIIWNSLTATEGKGWRLKSSTCSCERTSNGRSVAIFAHSSSNKKAPRLDCGARVFHSPRKAPRARRGQKSQDWSGRHYWYYFIYLKKILFVNWLIFSKDNLNSFNIFWCTLFSKIISPFQWPQLNRRRSQSRQMLVASHLDVHHSRPSARNVLHSSRSTRSKTGSSSAALSWTFCSSRTHRKLWRKQKRLQNDPHLRHKRRRKSLYEGFHLKLTWFYF